ncbi:MAG: hypothetical protein OEM38_00495 [Gammaproteobacteria bacterium]|nr:hypothetical protein [Gammaproteobacteria bacterium]
MDDQDVYLESPIKVSNGGDLDDCMVVTLMCPKKKFIRKTYKLQQLFTTAQVQQAELYASIIESREKDDETDDDKEDEKVTHTQIMQMLLSSRVNMEEVFDEFERLALLGAVMVNDKKINVLQWDAITDEDKEGLMAKYMAFFISTLALRSFKTT